MSLVVFVDSPDVVEERLAPFVLIIMPLVIIEAEVVLSRSADVWLRLPELEVY